MTELKDTTSGRMPSFLIWDNRFLAIPTSRLRAQAEITVLYVTTVLGTSISFIKSNNCIARRHISLFERADMTNSHA